MSGHATADVPAISGTQEGLKAMATYTVLGGGVQVDRPQQVLDTQALYQLTQFARRQVGLPPLVGNDPQTPGTVVVGGGKLLTEPVMLPMWAADP